MVKIPDSPFSALFMICVFLFFFLDVALGWDLVAGNFIRSHVAPQNRKLYRILTGTCDLMFAASYVVTLFPHAIGDSFSAIAYGLFWTFFAVDLVIHIAFRVKQGI